MTDPRRNSMRKVSKAWMGTRPLRDTEPLGDIDVIPTGYQQGPDIEGLVHAIDQKIGQAWGNLGKHPDAEDLLGRLGDKMYRNPTWLAWKAQGLIPDGPLRTHGREKGSQPEADQPQWFLLPDMYMFTVMRELMPERDAPGFADWPGDVTQTGDWLREQLRNSRRMNSKIANALAQIAWLVEQWTGQEAAVVTPHKRTKPAPASYRPPFSADGYGWAPSDSVARLLFDTFAAKQSDWEVSDQGEPVLRPHKHRKGQRYGDLRGAETRMTTPQEPIYMAAESAAEAVQRISVADWRYVLPVLALFTANPNEQEFRLDLSDLLRWAGLTPKRDKQGLSKGLGREERRLAAEALWRCSRLWWSGLFEVKHGAGKGTYTDTAFITIRGADRQPLLDGITEGGYPDLRAVLVAPGPWWDMVREAPQAQQLARLSQRLLQIDQRLHPYAFALGSHLMFPFRYKASREVWSTPYTVRDLLTDAGLIESKVKPNKRRTSFEDGLYHLQQLGLIGSWEYAPPHHPVSGPPMSGHGWYSVWLDSQVVILPPADLIEQYAPIATNRKAKLAAGSKKPRKPRAQPTTDGA